MRNTLKFSVVIVGLFFLWLVLLFRWQSSVKPGGQTLSDHLAKKGIQERPFGFTVDGKKYLALFGEVESFPAFPSGPPVYVFDQAGSLVDWTSNEGDDEAFHKKWPEAFHGSKITDVELSNWAGWPRIHLHPPP